MEGLKGRQAFVTGAAGGIGRATVLDLVRQGVAVVAADRNADDLSRTVAAAGAPGSVTACPLDVTDSAAVTAAIAAAEEDGGIDFLVNAAGVFGSYAVESISDDEWTRVFAVNANGVFHTCRAALPGMMRRGSGAIVNMSSLHAQNGQAGAAHYAASKAAVIGFTKSIAREKGPSGIRANCVAPGPIDTSFWRGDKSGEVLASAMRERVRSIPLGRLGDPEDVASVIVFLLSSGAAYVTGQVVPIGGGEIMR